MTMEPILIKKNLKGLHIGFRNSKELLLVTTFNQSEKGGLSANDREKKQTKWSMD